MSTPSCPSPLASGDPTPEQSDPGAADRRKVVHRGPRAGGGDEQDPALTPDRRKPVHNGLRVSGGGGQDPSPDRPNLAPDRRKVIHQTPRGSAGTRGTAARRLAATVMLLAMIGTALPASPGEHHDAQPVVVQEASAGSGLVALWALVVQGVHALRGTADICGDCQLPADDGCRCVCYSGGYDPDDPACQ